MKTFWQLKDSLSEATFTTDNPNGFYDFKNYDHKKVDHTKSINENSSGYEVFSFWIGKLKEQKVTMQKDTAFIKKGKNPSARYGTKYTFSKEDKFFDVQEKLVEFAKSSGIPYNYNLDAGEDFEMRHKNGGTLMLIQFKYVSKPMLYVLVTNSK